MLFWTLDPGFCDVDAQHMSKRIQQHNLDQRLAHSKGRTNRYI
jgi:hypothetical protein